MRLPFCLLLFLLVSCSVGPSFKSPCVTVPQAWKNAQEEQCATDSQGYLDFWWEVFNDERLNELEQLALKNNRDLYVAFERVQEYYALLGIAASNLYPQLTLNPLYTNTGELFKTYSPPGNAANNLGVKNIFRVHELLYLLPLNLSYQVDLWGQIRDQVASAKYDWLAQQKQYETAMLSITANLATTYYQLKSADTQEDLLAKVLQSRRKAYQINNDRYEEEIIFYADVALAGEEVESVLTQYEEVVRQRKVLENALAILSGIPASNFCLPHNPLEGLPPCIPENIPSDVLLQRPDIAREEFAMRSSHALVKEAYTQFLPSLTLTGTLGYESPVLKEFLKWLSRYWMEGVQINQLVFDGFKTPYNLQAQLARFAEASGTYQQTILIAFQEVEDALVNLNAYAKEYDSTLETVRWAQKAYDLYSDRYSHGLINYIDVVNTERDLLNFQIQLNTLQSFRHLATIQLIQALGGSWKRE